MKNLIHRIVYPGLLCILLTINVGCTAGDVPMRSGSDVATLPTTEPYSRVDVAMGTVFSLNLDMGEESEQIGQEIFSRVERLEREELSWRLDTSEIYRLNAAGEGEVSEELSRILEQCLKLCADSEGAFDPTVGSLSSLWDIDSWAAGEYGDTPYELPSEEDIKSALESVGYEKIVLEDNRIWLLDGARLDLGAVGKGVALDAVLKLLQVGGEEAWTNEAGAVISAGGSVLTYGHKRDGSLWHVAVVDPLDPSSILGTLELDGTNFISTSGDYERYVEVDGKRYCHIMNAKTGYPVDGGIVGVTILADNGLLSDGLSTACLILGSEKGSRLAKKYGAEALFVDRKGNITMTEGMKTFFRETTF